MSNSHRESSVTELRGNFILPQKEISLHECIQKIKICSEKNFNVPPPSEFTKHEKQIYYIKQEFAKLNNNYLRKLYLFYLTYSYLKFELATNVSAGKFDEAQLQQKDWVEVQIKQILSALTPVLAYQVEFNAMMEKFSMEGEAFNDLSAVLGQDIGREIVKLIKSKPDLWKDYTEGAVVLSMPVYYESIQEAMVTLYPMPEKESKKKSKKKDLPKERHETVHEFLESAGMKIPSHEMVLCDYKSYATTIVQRIAALPLVLSDLVKNINKALKADTESIEVSPHMNQNHNYNRQLMNLDQLLKEFKDNGMEINNQVKVRAGKLTLGTILDTLVDREKVCDEWPCLTRGSKEDEYIAKQNLLHYGKLEVLTRKNGENLIKEHFCFLFEKCLVMFEKRSSGAGYKITQESYEAGGVIYSWNPVLYLNSMRFHRHNMMTFFIVSPDNLMTECLYSFQLGNDSEGFKAWVEAIEKVIPKNNKFLKKEIKHLESKRGKQYPGEIHTKKTLTASFNKMTKRSQVSSSITREQQEKKNKVKGALVAIENFKRAYRNKPSLEECAVDAYEENQAAPLAGSKIHNFANLFEVAQKKKYLIKLSQNLPKTVVDFDKNWPVCYARFKVTDGILRVLYKRQVVRKYKKSITAERISKIQEKLAYKDLFEDKREDYVSIFNAPFKCVRSEFYKAASESVRGLAKDQNSYVCDIVKFNNNNERVQKSVRQLYILDKRIIISDMKDLKQSINFSDICKVVVTNRDDKFVLIKMDEMAAQARPPTSGVSCGRVSLVSDPLKPASVRDAAFNLVGEASVGEFVTRLSRVMSKISANLEIEFREDNMITYMPVGNSNVTRSVAYMGKGVVQPIGSLMDSLIDIFEYFISWIRGALTSTG